MGHGKAQALAGTIRRRTCRWIRLRAGLPDGVLGTHRMHQMARDRIRPVCDHTQGLCSQTLTPVRPAPLGIHRQLVLQCLPRFISEEPAPRSSLTLRHRSRPARSAASLSEQVLHADPPAPRRSCSGTRGWIGALQFDLADEGLTDAGHRREARNRHVTPQAPTYAGPASRTPSW